MKKQIAFSPVLLTKAEIRAKKLVLSLGDYIRLLIVNDLNS